MNNIRKARQSKGVNLKEFSDKLGIAVSTASMYENSKREPDFDTLRKMARFLDVSVDYLIGYDQPDVEQQKKLANIDELPLSERQKTLLKTFDRCNNENQLCVLAYAEGAADKR
jgi:transcriptional regulator with XRE-family HTH domain|nr:MAG TPA: Helix-turn-helix XRE-family like protein [Caudoviricetes sp.]